MIINVGTGSLPTSCECGQPATPGLFSVQVIGDGTQGMSQLAAEPVDLCEPCAAMASQPSEHALGVLVIRLAL